jgi:hypothetical protein
MPFTDQCDLFASFHEDGFNQIVRHARNQRPSLFNYGTQQVAGNPQLLCQVIDAHPIVAARNNPLLTIVEPLPVPGTEYGLNFAAQIVDLRVDFHPGGGIALPAELGPDLAEQRLALFVRLCAGIGCPPREIVDRLVPPPKLPTPRGREPQRDAREERPRLIPLPTRELTCFCLDVYATGGVRIRPYHGKPWLEPFLRDLEIVDIRPKGLEDALECYIRVLLQLTVLPGLRYLLEHKPLNIIKDKVKLRFVPTARPGDAPNPAIEEDQIKAFITLEMA